MRFHTNQKWTKKILEGSELVGDIWLTDLFWLVFLSLFLI